MHCVFHKNTGVTNLELSKWMKGMDKVGLLNLLWVPHYSCAPIAMIVIKQLLCLVHNGCLWLKELIPITDMLIHRVTWQSHSGENPAMAFGEKAGEHALAETMKEKFKLVKNPRGYAITNICEPVIKVATQKLVGKVMRKYRTDEVLTPTIALAA